MPRRSFATPLVVTFAAAPACFFSTSTPPSQPIVQASPGQPTSTETDPTPPPNQSPTIIVNPPPPNNGPITGGMGDPANGSGTVSPAPPPPARGSWSLMANPPNGCVTIESVTCPEGVMCNPPPPRPYACPDGVPLPATIYTLGNSCAITRPIAACPQGMHCNPPPPRRVPCPQP